MAANTKKKHNTRALRLQNWKLQIPEVHPHAKQIQLGEWSEEFEFTELDHRRMQTWRDLAEHTLPSAYAQSGELPAFGQSDLDEDATLCDSYDALAAYTAHREPVDEDLPPLLRECESCHTVHDQEGSFCPVCQSLFLLSEELNVSLSQSDLPQMTSTQERLCAIRITHSHPDEHVDYAESELPQTLHAEPPSRPPYIYIFWALCAIALGVSVGFLAGHIF